MGKLAEIIQKKKERRKKLEAALESIIAQLKNLGALEIILFGSLARGKIHTHSDLDILVIMPHSKSPKQWTDIIYDKVDRGIACDIFAYTQQEIDEELPVSSFLRHILKTGRVVYERTPRQRGAPLADAGKRRI